MPCSTGAREGHEGLRLESVRRRRRGTRLRCRGLWHGRTTLVGVDDSAGERPGSWAREQRIKAGLFTLHGVDLAPVSKTVELGRKLAAYRAGITARAFQNSLKQLRGNKSE